MPYLIAFDQGTTSSRAIVFAEDATIVGVIQREFEQIFPRPGWVEHDPEEIWKTQVEVTRAAIEMTGISATDIAAIGIANQRETTLVWERATGRPIANALVWQDRRTADTCDEARRAGAESLIREKTGLMIDPYFSASKLAWLLDNVAGARKRAERGELAFGTVDSWLIWKLTGGDVHATDATNASRTMLYDISAGSWDDELLSLWRIPRALLPRVVDSSGVCATTTLFGAEIPIAGVAGDQQAALFGQACFSPGMAKCTYGTGCFILMHAGNRPPSSQQRLLGTVAWQIDGQREYALEGSVFMGGATVQWLRDGVRIIDSAAAVEALAAEVDDSGGVILVPAFAGLGAPHWDAHARGLLIGLTRGTTGAHIARAALEGIAWQVTEVAQAMVADAGVELTELRVDGGASANALLMQMQADFLEVPLVHPRELESTAYGAVLLAGLATGIFKDRAAVADAWVAETRYQPRAAHDDIVARQRRWSAAVERAKGWAD